MRLPSKENWEGKKKKKKKPLVWRAERERGSGQQTRGDVAQRVLLESVVVAFKRTDLRKRVLQFLVEL
jgi:hypothetical protein